MKAFDWEIAVEYRNLIGQWNVPREICPRPKKSRARTRTQLTTVPNPTADNLSSTASCSSAATHSGAWSCRLAELCSWTRIRPGDAIFSTSAVGLSHWRFASPRSSLRRAGGVKSRRVPVTVMTSEPFAGPRGGGGGGATLPASPRKGWWSALPKLWEGQTLQEKAAKEVIDPSASW